MESNRKRRGFIKSKLGLPFYKAAKPSSSTVQYSTKATPNGQTSKQTVTVSYVVQEYIITQPKPKLSFVTPEKGRAEPFDVAYGDEAVDLKAANYISSVQERFKLERINSERKNCQDISQ
ncbi:uncharacterized protein LOC116194461 [Punica granatum]|uniref:Uncharacterized protein n=2 Tax=Punica granatum TaxID=22663 RepID=A0A218WHD1_PUNGR|nr:uncharacterized protein LOC116194461 [Punica granatum]OWM71422.1 hypothetical protein CDL15_Pgr005609 [Punica granatum]PKI60329.1 hypothetical protein CRG98_019265 [Punica granatum]